MYTQMYISLSIYIYTHTYIYVYTTVPLGDHPERGHELHQHQPPDRVHERGASMLLFTNTITVTIRVINLILLLLLLLLLLLVIY